MYNYFFSVLTPSCIDEKLKQHETDIQNLTAHIAQVHKDKKAEKCDKCNYETYTAWSLKKHIKTTHVEYKTCPYCKNDYKYLESHITRGKCYTDQKMILGF